MPARKERVVEQKRSVLVVDDDVTLLKMAEELLREVYAVSLAKSGRQAIALLTAGFVPDVVLLDIDMPGMDGYEALEGMLAFPSMAAVPVMFLTGISEPESELRGLSLGAADYVTKPFVREILLARIALQLKNRERLKLAMEQLQGEAEAEDRLSKLLETLTPTEQKVARLIYKGLSNREIGLQLHYSYAYIKKVSCVIFEKLGVSGRGELKKLL